MAAKKQNAPVTYRHTYMLSGTIVLDDNETRIDIRAGEAVVEAPETIEALDARPDFQRKETN